MKVIYVAGPFGANNDIEIQLNIASARKIGLETAKRGWSPIIPHSNTGGFEKASIKSDPGETLSFWYEATALLLTKCDALVLCLGWESSVGTLAELNQAGEMGIPVYY